MKKILFILFFLFLISCLSPNYTSKFKQNYSQTQKEIMIEDIYLTKYTFNIDSIPFQDWIVTQEETARGYKIERSYILKDSWNHEFLFIYNTFIEKDTIYYEFEILEKGNYNSKK